MFPAIAIEAMFGIGVFVLKEKIDGGER